MTKKKESNFQNPSQIVNESEKLTSTIENYLSGKRIAASILLIFGLVLIASNFGLTGAVIGAVSKGNPLYGVFGFLILVASTALFFKSSKKKMKI